MTKIYISFFPKTSKIMQLSSKNSEQMCGSCTLYFQCKCKNSGFFFWSGEYEFVQNLYLCIVKYALLCFFFVFFILGHESFRVPWPYVEFQIFKRDDTLQSEFTLYWCPKCWTIIYKV